MRRSYSCALELTAIAACAGLVAGCGSSSHGQASATATVKSTCLQVSAALADGPDPDADPVGYALAQVRPLQQIHTADKSLQATIAGLASAYQQFSSTNGAAAAKQAVSQASKKINIVCPGAAS